MIETTTVSETVTLTRAEWDAVQDRLQDLSDQLAVKRSEERLATLGADEARRLSYTAEEARRIALDDMAPLNIWRERAGLSQRALAAAAKVSPSYLAEIEAGKKPASVAALASLAAVLAVPMEHLIAVVSEPASSRSFSGSWMQYGLSLHARVGRYDAPIDHDSVWSRPTAALPSQDTTRSTS